MPYGLGELKPFLPASSLISGFEAGEQLQMSGLKRQAAQEALTREREMTSALQEYKQTGEPAALRGVNPELAMRLQKHLDKQDPESLKGYGKAASFIQRVRGIVTPENWSAVKADIDKQGWLPPGTLPDKVDPQSLQNILYGAETTLSYLKSAPQRITAESRERAARETAASRERVAGIGASSRLGAADISAGARVKAAEIRAKGGTGRAGSRFINYNDWEADYLRNNPSATKTDAWQEFNTQKSRGAQFGKAEAPPVQSPTPDVVKSAVDSLKDDLMYNMEIDPEKKKKILLDRIETFRQQPRTVTPRSGKATVKPAGKLKLIGKTPGGRNVYEDSTGARYTD
jgi:hypothetical protein